MNYNIVHKDITAGQEDSEDRGKMSDAETDIEELFETLDTPEWNEAFEYLAAH